MEDRNNELNMDSYLALQEIKDYLTYEAIRYDTVETKYTIEDIIDIIESNGIDYEEDI